MSLHCFAGNEDGTINIPFTESDGLILLEGELDGLQGVLIFDTGAHEIILNETQSKDDRQTFETISGEVSMGLKDVLNLRIGGVNFESIKAYTRDLSHVVLDSDRQLIGIVGASIFKSKVLHIDHKNNVIKIHSQSSLSGFDKSSAVVSDIDVLDNLVTIPVEIGATSYNFIFDTGASVSLIDTDLMSQLDSASDFHKTINIVSAEGTQSAQQINKLDLASINNLKIKDLEYASVEMDTFSEALDKKIDGVLAISQLSVSETLIDFYQKKIYFIF